MKVTALTSQVRDKNRINVMLDGKFKFSLDVSQIVDLGVKVGREYTEEEIERLEVESSFGKVYSRALEYSLVRPRSQKEVRDYLYRKTLDRPTRDGPRKPGISKEVSQMVFSRLVERGYVDDQKFATFWVENRKLRKGVSAKMLRAELLSKGVDSDIVAGALESSGRSDKDELDKVIAKKARLYDTRDKLVAYLLRQGYRYDDIATAIEELED